MRYIGAIIFVLILAMSIPNNVHLGRAIPLADPIPPIPSVDPNIVMSQLSVKIQPPGNEDWLDISETLDLNQSKDPRLINGSEVEFRGTLWNRAEDSFVLKRFVVAIYNQSEVVLETFEHAFDSNRPDNMTINPNEEVTEILRMTLALPLYGSYKYRCAISYRMLTPPERIFYAFAERNITFQLVEGPPPPPIIVIYTVLGSLGVVAIMLSIGFYGGRKKREILAELE